MTGHFLDTNAPWDPNWGDNQDFGDIFNLRSPEAIVSAESSKSQLPQLIDTNQENDFFQSNFSTPSNQTATATSSTSFFQRNGQITDITGSVDGMISLRHQEHMWVTDDGAIHTVINVGNNGDNRGLVLYSSFDGGTTWQQMLPIGYTASTSTSDGLLAQGFLGIVTSTPMGKIIYSLAQYDQTAQTWTHFRTDLVSGNSGEFAYNPTLTTDANQQFWTTFVTKDLVTGLYEFNIAYQDPTTKEWQDTEVNLTIPNPSLEKSGRLVALDDGVGMVYTDGDTLNWAYRSNGDPVDAPWEKQTLLQRSLGNHTDPFGSHFSVAVDADDNIHLATIEDERLLYLQFDSNTQTWEDPRVLTNDLSVAYMQTSISTNGNIYISFNAGYAIGVMESNDGGDTFSWNSVLLNPLASEFDTPVDLTRPRLETPGLVGNNLFVLKQFARFDGTQGLISYRLPLV
jgi:hypothetical protein